MSAQRFTVEEIEAAANECSDHEFRLWRHDMCNVCGASKARHEWAEKLRAFALQTQRVEQMREWLEKKAAVSMSTGNDTVNLLLASSETAMYGALQEFSCLFPKEGGQ